MPINLKPITDEDMVKHIKFGTWDIESQDWTKHVCNGYYDQYTDEFTHFSTIQKFVHFIWNHSQEEGIDAVFAHNGGGYDFLFLLKEIMAMKGFYLEKGIMRGSSILCMTIKKKGSDHKLSFWDSLALLPFGLARLAKTFGVKTQKGDCDYLNVAWAYKNKDYTKRLFDLIKNPSKVQQDRVETIWYNGKQVMSYKSHYKKEKITYCVKRSNGTRVKFNIQDRNDVLKYLESDLKALSQCIDEFYSWELVQRSGSAFTTASQALKITRLFLDKEVHSLSKSVDDFVRKSYLGGRTEMFRPVFDSEYDCTTNPLGFSKEVLKELRKQKKHEKLMYGDINSLYPTVMKNNRFPNKFKYITEDPADYNPKGLDFWDVTVEVPKDMYIPPLGVKVDYTRELVEHNFKDFPVEQKEKLVGSARKLIFPTGTFRSIYTVAEIEYAKSLGVKVLKYHEGAIFEDGGYMFKDFIDTLYNMRLEAKKNGDKVKDLLTKLIMNSCYGKFAQANDGKENLVMDDGSEGLKPVKEIKDSDGNIQNLAKKSTSLNSPTHVGIGSYITSYARILMHKYYMKCGKALYYTDTDSIHYTGEKRFKFGDKLGELKLEYTTRSSVFLLPKTYINDKVEGEDFTKKIKAKGMASKDAGNFTQDEFLRAHFYGEFELLKIEEKPKFASLKVALKKDEFVCMDKDSEFEIKVAKREVKKFKQILKTYEDLDKKELTKEDKREIASLKSKIRAREKKIAQGPKKSFKAVKSAYNKRVLTKDKMDTKPIHLKKEWNL